MTTTHIHLKTTNKPANLDANLDIIAEHRSGKLTIGVEAKNTLSIIPKEEIDER